MKTSFPPLTRSAKTVVYNIVSLCLLRLLWSKDFLGFRANRQRCPSKKRHEQLCEVRSLQDACSLVPPTTVTTNACLSCWSRVVHGPRISQRMSSQFIWRDVVIPFWRPIKSSTIFLGPTWRVWILVCMDLNGHPVEVPMNGTRGSLVFAVERVAAEWRVGTVAAWCSIEKTSKNLGNLFGVFFLWAKSFWWILGFFFFNITFK